MTATFAERIVSCDDHMDMHVLPPTLFTDRLPASLRDQAPRVVDTPNGPFWQAEGRLLSPSGRKASGIDPHQLGFRPGIAKSRLEDMDRDGISASVIYGNPNGFPFKEHNLADACLRAYNDWADEFNAADRNRLVVLANLPSHSPDVATAELLRVAKMGHRGAVFKLHDNKGDSVFFPEWEKFWAAANDTEVPIHFHLGGGVHSLPYRQNSWAYPAHVTVVPMQLDEALVGMCFSGILERHPKVKAVLAESGLGWIPYVLERMDYEYKKYYDAMKDYRIKEPPTYYWHRQMFATYEEEHFGLDHLDRIGVDNVMWASDYPHGDTTWPNSRQAIMESPLGKMSAEVRRKLVCETAAKLYKIV